MAQGMVFSIFLMLWLAGRASADGGDDFANNLASDLGPIIALFGERVVMQFMSQAMGISDCILLAVAPIGAITTVVSAIRVAGPAWLKSFIGRARENLSAAEIDVMSSTSKEACELWNGNSVVRCPGSADIYQFICLIPKHRDAKFLSDIQTTIQYMTLDKAAEENGLLREIPTAGLAYARQAFEEGLKSLQNRLIRYYSSLLRRKSPERDPEIADHQQNSSATTVADNSVPPSTKKPPLVSVDSMSSKESKESKESDQQDTSNTSNHGDQQGITVIVDSSDDNTPNLLLNCHDKVGRSEIYLAAALGVVLQLGAVIYFGFITYHRPIKDQFLKDGRKIVDYAFPCAAAGTVLLVFGLFICSWVVEKSTKETCYKADQHRMFIVWLQKHHTLSDQVFKPYAIYPTSEREYITFSRRNIGQSDQKIRDIIRQSGRKIIDFFQARKNNVQQEKNDENQPPKDQSLKDQNITEGTTKGRNMNNESQNAKREQIWDDPLEFITFFGALISLVGFISQFIGMRGLNWTASIVQLGITIVVTVIRVIVRRGLGKSPARTILASKSELDWFALSFGEFSTAPWATLDGKSTNGSENDASKDENSPKWSIRTGGEYVYLPLKPAYEESSQREKNSKAHKMMVTRQELMRISKWKSPVFEEAMRLSAAIEAVADTFLEKSPEGTCYVWTIPAIYGTQNNIMKRSMPEESMRENIYIQLEKKDVKWEVSRESIEAVLSLWLYSVPRVKRSDINQPRQLRLYGSSKLKNRLSRDLQWWMPEVITEISTQTKADVMRKMESPEWTVVGFTAEEGSDQNQEEEYLALECQETQKRLFSRDLFFSFMRAVAKMPEVVISSASSVQQLNYSKMTAGWKQLKVKNDTISNLARKLEKIGFGTLSDIYFDLIVPLSLEQKLTNLKNVIDEATEQSQTYEQACHWKKLVDSCSCLLDLALQFDLEKESSGPLAIAVCLGFLSRLRHESALQQYEGREEEELTKQLKILINKFKDESFASSINFSIPARGIMKEWHYAMPFNTIIGNTADNIKSLPNSFQVTSDHKQFMQESESEKTLYVWDFGTLEKADAFGWSPLHYAANIQLHNIRIVFSRDGEGDALNLRDFMGWTPLQHACLVGNERVVDVLLDRDAPIDIAGYDGITPMHCAVRSGNVDILQMLVEKANSGRKRHTRKSVAHVDRNERHPIHWAAIKGDVKLVWLLKDDISLKDRFGWTCLHLAAIYGHEELLLMILDDCGADINVGDNDNRTPLHLAIENKKKSVIPLLITAHADVNAKAKDGSTPLHIAVKQKDTVHILLNNEADKEAIDLEGRTPLYQALADGTIEVAELLIDKGANVATAAKDGRTPLHMALSLGTKGFSIAKRLLDSNLSEAAAYARATAKDEATPLHIAAEYGPSEAIQMLLDLGANIDAWDDFGQTPLLISIYKKNWGIAELLLKNDADVEADSREGYSPLLGAVAGGSNKIVQQLLQAKVDVDAVDEDGYSPLHLAVTQKELNILQQLLKTETNIDAISEAGRQTALHIAVRNGDRESVQILLEKGASTTLHNSRGFSPLQQALYIGDLELVQDLVAHDKKAGTKVVLQKGEDGNTPMHTLCQWTYYESDEETMLEMLDELLRASSEIDINAKNNENLTPLDLAISSAGKYRGFIEKLVEKGATSGSEESVRAFEAWKKDTGTEESQSEA